MFFIDSYLEEMVIMNKSFITMGKSYDDEDFDEEEFDEDFEEDLNDFKKQPSPKKPSYEEEDDDDFDDDDDY